MADYAGLNTNTPLLAVLHLFLPRLISYQDLGLPMLSDIKNQLNQMQSETMASAGRDAEAIAEVVRNEIRRAMMVRGKSGVTIRETIDEKVAGFERDDYDDGRGGGSKRYVQGSYYVI